METLSSIDAIFKAFGSVAKTALWARSSYNAVYWWRKRGIPPGLHLSLVLELWRRGYVVERDVLDIPKDDYELLYQGLREANKPKRLKSSRQRGEAVPA